MKDGRRLIVTLLIMVTVLAASTAFPAAAAAASDTFEQEGILYQYWTTEKTTARVVGCKDTVSELLIPEKAGGATVTDIWEGAFEGNRVIRSVSIPRTAKEVGANAFRGCTNLSKVTLGDYKAWCGEEKPYLESQGMILGNCAFEGCTSLEEISLPANVWGKNSENKYAFQGSGLKKVIYNDTDWNYVTMRGCDKLEVIVFKNCALKIGEDKFKDLPALKEVYADNAERMTFVWGTANDLTKGGAFYNCPKLRDVYLSYQSYKENDYTRYSHFYYELSSKDPKYNTFCFRSSDKNVVKMVNNAQFQLAGNGSADLTGPNCPFTLHINVGEQKARKNISDCSVELAKNSYSKTGKSMRARVIVKDKGKLLKNERDYTVSYRNNDKIGTAEAVVQGMGSYQGSVSKAYSIIPLYPELCGVSVEAKKLTLKWNEVEEAIFSSKAVRFSTFA